MRIVSQDRSLSVDFDHVLVELRYDDTIVCEPYEKSEKSMVLGKYTPKRAQEVFQDIHNVYAPVDMVFINAMPDEELLKNMGRDIKGIIINGENASVDVRSETVYYMPEE